MSLPLGFLHSFAPAKFGFSVAQKEGLRWLMQALLRAKKSTDIPKMDKALQLYEQFLTADYLERRTTCLSDYTHQDWNAMTLYRECKSRWYRPSLESRMEVFKEQSLAIVQQNFPKESSAPDFLIQVSCTGYDSPHASQRVIGRNGWTEKTKFLHVGHMGCYAALPTAHMAAKLVDSNERASLMLIELCTLHLDPIATETQAVVLNTLFADGAIRFDVSRDKHPRSLALFAHRETIVEDSEREMTWTPKDSVFGMTLSRAVPVMLSRNLSRQFNEMVRPFGLVAKDITCFAIHPGGPKIIDLVGETLNLENSQMIYSRNILKTRGNMSSCTVPHIWNEILDDPTIATGSWIVSFAFGPGLTLVANLLRKEND